MATEKLSIELEAKVGKYKSDVRAAQKALLKLENEALKTGGANKKMAAQIAIYLILWRIIIRQIFIFKVKMNFWIVHLDL